MPTKSESPSASAPEAPTAPVGTRVHVLHRFGNPSGISVHPDYPAALAALAAACRAEWSEVAWRADVPASPDGLSDAQAVLLFYGGNGGQGGPDAPTFGMSLNAGFAIAEEVVTGPGPSAAPPVGAAVQLLHRWDRFCDETSLYRDYPAALAALAAACRAEWSEVAWRADVPASPDGLSDAETVLVFYGGDGGAGGPDAPTCGESIDAGFEIVDEVVAGPEPSAVSLRLGTFRVVDADPADDDVPAVTYCLDAAGLTVAVAAGPDGYPSVSITPKDHLTGIPVKVRLEDPFGPGGTEQTYQVP